jgi:hypothetical protein
MGEYGSIIIEWYKPIKGKKVSLEELNEIERENIAIIKAEIDER